MPDFSVTASIDSESERRIRLALDQFPIAVQDAMVRRAIRKFLGMEMKQIRALNAKTLPPKHLKGKVKLFASGIAWGASAYKTGRTTEASKRGKGGRALRRVYDADGVGWRSHFTELGTHTWSSSLRRPPRAVGRGWKRGLYHRGRGNYIRGTHASENVHRAMSPMFSKIVADELRDVITDRRGSAPASALRTVEEFA